MLQYKTTCVPAKPYIGTKQDFANGLTVELGNKAVAPMGKAIEEEARGGWTLHSMECIPQTIRRKMTFWEKLLGWIPFIGPKLFPGMVREVMGIEVYLYILIFVKES